MIRLISTIVISLFLCNSTWATDIEVGYAGALKNFMFKGDISSKFSLSELKGKEHIYALGAVENLKGEIQIFDGTPLVTFSESDEIAFDKTFNKNAALIVYAQVPKWTGAKIPSEINTRSQLENHIQESAIENGLNIDKPFPFLITGKINFIDWHIINWKQGDMEHSHSKHIKSGPNGKLEGSEVVVLGFYSNKHKAIFTHHSTYLHMHFKTKDNKLAGHIDDMQLGQNMFLQLPKIEQ